MTYPDIFNNAPSYNLTDSDAIGDKYSVSSISADRVSTGEDIATLVTVSGKEEKSGEDK